MEQVEITTNTEKPQNTVKRGPSLYVGTFEKYNNGSIEGAWLYLENYADADAFYVACARLHSDECDPEFMFQDYENFPQFLYSECGNIEEIYEWLDYDDDEKNAIEAWLNGISDIPIADWGQIIDKHNGIWESEQAFAWDLVENCGGFNDIPEHLQYYFDCESYARDLFFGDFVSAYDSAGNMHVFSNH
jgi:antirestriction protein